MFGKGKIEEIFDGMMAEDILHLENKVDELEKQITALRGVIRPEHTSIKVGDKVMLKKDMTKVYEVESVINGKLLDSPTATAYRLSLSINENWDKIEIKYSLSNNRVYTEDQILPFNEGQHLLALEIKKLKK